MIVYLRPATGTPKDNLDRAKIEMERVINFRGKVVSAKVEGNSIVVKVKINPQWELAEAEKVSSLSEWIKAKTRTVFKVDSII